MSRFARLALLAAALAFACHDGEPRGDDPVVGAWIREDDPAPGTPMFFHVSGALDDQELGIFPGAPSFWSRQSDAIVRIWPGELDVTVSELSPGKIEISWSGGSIRLVRAPYLVRPKGDAVTCFP